MLWDTAYTRDQPLMEALGLKTSGFNREWTDLGTVEVFPAETKNPYDCLTGPRPATTVKVEVMAMPAMFWRFTVTRPQDKVVDDADAPLGWRPVYEPVQVFAMTTGSGSFTEYWPAVRQVADHCLYIKRLQ